MVVISGTSGSRPKPYRRLNDVPGIVGEDEQYCSRSRLSSEANVFALEAERKSSHGFAELG